MTTGRAVHVAEASYGRLANHRILAGRYIAGKKVSTGEGAGGKTLIGVMAAGGEGAAARIGSGAASCGQRACPQERLRRGMSSSGVSGRGLRSRLDSFRSRGVMARRCDEALSDAFRALARCGECGASSAAALPAKPVKTNCNCPNAGKFHLARFLSPLRSACRAPSSEVRTSCHRNRNPLLSANFANNVQPCCG